MSSPADRPPPEGNGWRIRSSLIGIASAAVFYGIYAIAFGPGPEKSFPAGIAAALILFSLWYAVDAWRADRPEDVGMPRGDRDRSAPESSEPEDPGAASG